MNSVPGVIFVFQNEAEIRREFRYYRILPKISKLGFTEEGTENQESRYIFC